jgi:hypothetical protein
MALSRNGPIGTAEIEEICDLRDDAYRNRWITYAYWKISQRLKEHIGDNASWCTFSTWSSRTIGESIRLDKATRRIEELIYDEQSSISLRDHPELLRLQYRVTTRDDGKAQIALAIGNRVIFHEIGTAVVQLIDWIKEHGTNNLAGWKAYRKENVKPYEVNLLFPLPKSRERQLWKGLDCYYKAAGAQSADEQAELVLQGNIRLGAYEQRRADRLLKVALEPFPGRYVRRRRPDPAGPVVFSLVVEGAWALEGPWHLRIVSEQFAEFMTRYVMALEAPLFSWTIRHLRLGHGLPRPDDDAKRFYPPALENPNDKTLNLFRKYDHSDGVPERCAAQNWTRFEDRMNFIVNLFRAGQQDPNLYRELPGADLRTLHLDLSDEHLDKLRELGDDEIDLWIEDYVEGLGVGVTRRHFLEDLVDYGFEELLAADAARDEPPPDLPAWADRAKLWAGQAFFRAYGLEIGAALFSASLPMGYTAKRGAEVLKTTTDLVEPSTAHRRLGETGQMLLDTMASDDSSKPPLDPETRAYQAARGIRLFHAAVRLWIRSPEQDWDEDELGVPLNQEDLIGTLAAFTVAVIGSLDQMGVTVKVQDRDAYFHLWLVMGDLLGIDYQRLFREGAAPAPDEQPLTYADMQLVARVIFDRNAAASTGGETLMGALLNVTEGSMPPRLEGLPRALTRELIGDRYANMLRVPPAGAIRFMTRALRPVNAMISPYVPRNAFGGLASRFTRGAYEWWIKEGRGHRPPWREAPSSWRESVPTLVSRHLATAADRAPFVPATVRRLVSGVLRPNAR